MGERPGQGRHPALTDLQTALPNRLHFDTVFEVTFAASRRGLPLTLLVAEIDDFHRWIQRTEPGRWGQVLRSLGLTLGGAVRMSDVVARIEEARIAVALLDCDRLGGEIVARRIQNLLGAFRKETGLAVGLGGAQARESMVHPRDLLDAAERALRIAQGRGRNEMEILH